MKKRNGSKAKKYKKPAYLRVVHPTFKLPRTIGQKTADWLTKWAGSWAFIILFFLFLAVWMTTNGYFLLQFIRGNLTDPYPFILLNLALSCLAAIQAPIILMSQNRENHQDRLKAQYDYALNRKSEKEIQDIKKQLNRIEKSMMKRRKK